MKTFCSISSLEISFPNSQLNSLLRKEHPIFSQSIPLYSLLNFSFQKEKKQEDAYLLILKILQEKDLLPKKLSTPFSFSEKENYIFLLPYFQTLFLKNPRTHFPRITPRKDFSTYLSILQKEVEEIEKISSTEDALLHLETFGFAGKGVKSKILYSFLQEFIHNKKSKEVFKAIINAILAKQYSKTPISHLQKFLSEIQKKQKNEKLLSSQKALLEATEIYLLDAIKEKKSSNIALELIF